MNKAEQLIACLEGEIAKRDEVIVGLTNSRDFWREKAIAADDELAVIKAQEPVVDEQAAFKDWIARVYPSGDCSSVTEQWLTSSDYADLYAAPVSEAKAQGVYSTDPLACTGCASGCFRCLNATPVQQVNAPAWMASSRAFADRLYMAGWRDHADAQHSGVAGMYDELLSAAPAADAPSVEMVQAACAAFRMDISPMLAMHDALCAALAAHCAAKGVV